MYSTSFLTSSAFFIFAFVFGAIIGSFLNVCIYRIPRGESIISPPSHCPQCKTPLRFYNNIPFLSYLLQGGKCSSCGTRISFSYFAIEFLAAILTLLIFISYGFAEKTLIYLVLTYSLIVISAIDIRYMVIPNIITIPGIFAGLFLNALLTDWSVLRSYLTSSGVSDIFFLIGRFPVLNSITGIILGGGILLSIAYIYKLLRKIEGMGMGDVKLLAMLGAFLGIQGVVFIVFLSSMIGSITGVSLMIYNKGDLKYAIPYGPFLSLAAVAFMLYDNIFYIFR